MSHTNLTRLRPLLSLALAAAFACNEQHPAKVEDTASMSGSWVSRIPEATFTLALVQQGNLITGTFTSLRTGSSTPSNPTHVEGQFVGAALTLAIDPPGTVTATTPRAFYVANRTSVDVLDGSWQDNPTVLPVFLIFTRQRF